MADLGMGKRSASKPEVIEYVCAKCSAKLEADSELCGTTNECSECHTLNVVPLQSGQEEKIPAFVSAPFFGGLVLGMEGYQLAQLKTDIVIDAGTGVLEKRVDRRFVLD